jgi:hypothetical protein
LSRQRRLGVDAKDENAVTFYRLQAFRPFASRPMSLFLPLGTVKKAQQEFQSRNASYETAAFLP